MSRLNRRHRAAARLIVALAGGLAIGLTIGGDAEQPAWLGVAAATLLVMLVIGAYELSVALLTRALSRVLPRGEAPELSEAIPPARPRTWHQIRAPQALVLVGAYLAGQLLIWIIVVVIALFRAGDPGDTAAVQQQVFRLAPAGLIFSVLASGLSVFALYRRKMGPAAMSAAGRELGWGSVGPAHLVVGFLFGLAIAVAYLMGAPRLAESPRLTEMGILSQLAAAGGLARAAWAVAGVGLAPVLEETVFRGALFTGVERSWGTAAAVVLTTVVFAALHLPDVGAYWPAAGAITLLGLVTALLRARTGRIAPSIAAHSAFNLVMVLTVYGIGFPVSTG